MTHSVPATAGPSSGDPRRASTTLPIRQVDVGWYTGPGVMECEVLEEVVARCVAGGVGVLCGERGRTIGSDRCRGDPASSPPPPAPCGGWRSSLPCHAGRRSSSCGCRGGRRDRGWSVRSRPRCGAEPGWRARSSTRPLARAAWRFEYLLDIAKYTIDGRSGPIQYRDLNGATDQIQFVDVGKNGDLGNTWTGGNNRDQRYAGYAQDRWNLNNRTTITAGLRWDYQRPYYLDGKRDPIIKDVLPASVGTGVADRPADVPGAIVPARRHHHAQLVRAAPRRELRRQRQGQYGPQGILRPLTTTTTPMPSAR